MNQQEIDDLIYEWARHGGTKELSEFLAEKLTVKESSLIRDVHALENVMAGLAEEQSIGAVRDIYELVSKHLGSIRSVK